jgi:hypothetical protein
MRFLPSADQKNVQLGSHRSFTACTRWASALLSSLHDSEEDHDEIITIHSVNNLISAILNFNTRNLVNFEAIDDYFALSLIM